VSSPSGPSPSEPAFPAESLSEEQPDLREQPGSPPLARSTVDRAAFRRTDDAWLADAWSAGRVVVVDVVTGGRALVTDRPDGSSSLVLQPSKEAPEAERWFLGVDADGTPLWAVDAPLPEVPDTRAVTLREIGHLLDDRDTGIFTEAAALANWHASHRYSPRNGQLTTVVEAGWARRDAEGKLMWPRTDPAMIVLVHDGVAGPDGCCLLGHNSAWGTGSNGVRRFSCLAGYVEPGESAEAAVVREVDKEVGVQLGALRYAGSQSWPYPGSLMLGFHAVAEKDQPFRLDPEEIDEAHWFSRDDIAKMIAGDYVHPETGVRMSLPMPSSIAFYLVEQWLRGFAR
jgi:NAD+ diphosphatase